jgi:hypothetical protein
LPHLYKRTVERCKRKNRLFSQFLSSCINDTFILGLTHPCASAKNNRMTFGEKLANWLKMTEQTDAALGASLNPPVTGACVWGWRRNRSEPARVYRRQIIELSKGVFTAEDFI